MHTSNNSNNNSLDFQYLWKSNKWKELKGFELSIFFYDTLQAKKKILFALSIYTREEAKKSFPYWQRKILSLTKKLIKINLLISEVEKKFPATTRMERAA